MLLCWLLLDVLHRLHHGVHQLLGSCWWWIHVHQRLEFGHEAAVCLGYGHHLPQHVSEYHHFRRPAIMVSKPRCSLWPCPSES